MVFNSPTRLYEYLVMPSALTNAKAVFQVLIDDFVGHVEPFGFCLYRLHSDLLHVNGGTCTACVLLQLLKDSLFVKAEKCECHLHLVLFLG